MYHQTGNFATGVHVVEAVVTNDVHPLVQLDG